MDTGRANLRIPRRAQAQWNRVKAKLAEQIEARGQEADGPTVFCEACAMLDAMTGGMGTIADVKRAFLRGTGRNERRRAYPARTAGAASGGRVAPYRRPARPARQKSQAKRVNAGRRSDRPAFFYDNDHLGENGHDKPTTAN